MQREQRPLAVEKNQCWRMDFMSDELFDGRRTRLPTIVDLAFSRPGKPADGADLEPFNGRFRQEGLNEHGFLSLDDARDKVEARRRDDNEERPHSALGNATTEEHAAQVEPRKVPLEADLEEVQNGLAYPKSR